LEEDAGKLLHDAPGGFAIDHSIVDLNRAGTPLLEIVTEPDLSTPEQVRLFAQELQRVVQFLGVSEGQMQMGHMRFEPNINVHITDQDGVVHKTAITEIKNLNSFSVLERATAYEIRRQIDQWEQTGSLGRKSTYGWDEKSESTFHQRDKEDAHDYRYFPDPDLTPVEVDDAWLGELKSRVRELPAARRKRYAEALGLSPADAAALASDRRTGDLFEEAVRLGAAPKRASNLVTNTLAQLANERGRPVHDLGLTGRRVADVAALLDQNLVAASNAPALFTALADAPDADPRAAAERLGLLQVSDTGAIDAAIDALFAQNPKSLQDVRAGKLAAIGSLVGMIMKSGKGLNPKLVQERLRARLGI
jgi:aspartyl-tRNA(Asn)/glutamyl-tRNA(Gln) amidotransferase subunit B